MMRAYDEPQKTIQPFSREAYQGREYNEINGYTRRGYEHYAPFDADEYDDWLEHEGIPDDD